MTKEIPNPNFGLRFKALLSRNLAQDVPDRRQQAVQGLGGRLAQARFEPGKEVLNGIVVRGIRGQRK